MHAIITAGLIAAAFSVAPASAGDKSAGTYAIVNPDVGVPVFPNDITDRPYIVLGDISAGVRKKIGFGGEVSQEKIYRELWERAQKMCADAVVNARYGDSHVTAFSFGKTNATGTAIRFKPAP